LLPTLKTVALAVCCLLLAGCLGGARTVSTAEKDGLAIMMADLQQSRVVFVGEFHEQRDHHRLQLEVIKALHLQGGELAIGLEMFDLEQQPTLDEWVSGRLPLQEFMARYRQGWNIDWAEYDAILLFARNNRIPLIALDTPADIVRRVMHGGHGIIGSTERRRLPVGITTDISPSYRDFMSRAFSRHQLAEQQFDLFCAAQGLRNSTMASRISQYLAAYPQRRMVVLAGVGHAIRRAVPSLLTLPGLPAVRIVIPRVEGLYQEMSRDDADYFVRGD
jgi:uncharacterized iron-regulated protein